MPNQQLLQPNLLNHPRKAKLAIRLLFRRTFLYFNIVEQTTLPTGKFYFSKDAGLHYSKHYSTTISKPKFAPLANLILERILLWPFSMFKCVSIEMQNISAKTISTCYKIYMDIQGNESSISHTFWWFAWGGEANSWVSTLIIIDIFSWSPTTVNVLTTPLSYTTIEQLIK